jgi:hypothetical protein
MTALAVISALVAVGIVTAILFTLWILLQVVVWLVLLPFRLLFALVTWPLAIVKGVVGVLVGGVLLVVGLVAAVVVAVSMVAALLLPLALVALAVWALVRLTRRPAVAAP